MDPLRKEPNVDQRTQAFMLQLIQVLLRRPKKSVQNGVKHVQPEIPMDPGGKVVKPSPIFPISVASSGQVRTDHDPEPLNPRAESSSGAHAIEGEYQLTNSKKRQNNGKIHAFDD